jgi:hypothetical protein
MSDAEGSDDADMRDPLVEVEPPPLSEQIAPYLTYDSDSDDTHLAMSLLMYQRKFGGPGVASPAKHGADFHCPNCEIDVRGVSKNGRVQLCPKCGECPGALALGKGPKRE